MSQIPDFRELTLSGGPKDGEHVRVPSTTYGCIQFFTVIHTASDFYFCPEQSCQTMGYITHLYDAHTGKYRGVLPTIDD